MTIYRSWLLLCSTSGATSTSGAMCMRGAMPISCAMSTSGHMSNRRFRQPNRKPLTDLPIFTFSSIAEDFPEFLLSPARIPVLLFSPRHHGSQLRDRGGHPPIRAELAQSRALPRYSRLVSFWYHQMHPECILSSSLKVPWATFSCSYELVVSISAGARTQVDASHLHQPAC